MKIAESVMEENGWSKHTLYSFDVYRKTIKEKYHLLLRKLSNTINLDWSVQIDNELRESIGGADVDTYEQIEEMINIFEFIGVNKITKENLIEHGYKQNMNDNAVSFTLFEKKIGKYFVSINNCSNTSADGWNVHIDNDCMDSVCSLDISYYEQIDKLIKLL